MKEATGELNMTVVTVVAIAAIGGFFYMLIWPSIKTGMALTSACNAAGTGEYNMTDSDGNTISCAAGVCTYTDKNGTQNQKTCSQESTK